jgi:hypothetical protein
MWGIPGLNYFLLSILGMVYWGRTPLKTNRVRYEYNRPFLEAKDYQDNDAMAVEATGYALLTMFKVEGGGVTIIQDQVGN